MNRNDIIYIIRDGVGVPKINGYNHFIYNNAIEGLQAIKSQPLVVVIDLGLTRVTGIDCLKMIRTNPFNHQIKIIVCMKKYNYNLIKKSFNLGADFYLKLPFEIRELKNIIKDINKNIKTFSLESIINYTNYENIALQNSEIEV